MEQINKTRWVADENSVRIGVEFSKVNKQKRLVSGWATLDNVDTEGDVVTAEASKDAFNRARGNLREMHKKDSAVGRIVSFKEDTMRVKEGNEYKEYRGIFVTARVSEGAQDTWLKVLDGTLSGFSIGGEIVEAEEDFNKSTGEKIRKVVKYNLNELSLVDNPGNQYSDITNIFKIKKSADGSVTALSGMIEDHKVYNVFFCNEDKITQEKPDDSYACPVCDSKMEVIGFIEDGSDRSEKVNAVVNKYLGQGGETMAKNKDGEQVDESVETGHEAGDPKEVPLQEGPTDADVEEVEDYTSEPEATVEEVHDESEEISKQIDGLKKSIKEILEDSKQDTHQKIEALEKAVKETRDFFDTKISELDNKVNGFEQSLEVTKSRITNWETQLEKMNSSTALKKSADSEGPAETVQKSDTGWGGNFSDPRNGNGAFSVDNLR